MRAIDKDQILTSEIVDANGNKILASGIDWTRFRKNPVLRYDPVAEGHKGVVVGKVEDIRCVGTTHVGRLTFMERYDVADIAYEKYAQGVLPYVSIGGFGAGKRENGVLVADVYIPIEVSLVANPANIECAAVDAKTIQASADDEDVKRLSEDGRELVYLTMCAELNPNNNENNKGMQEVDENVVETTVEASVETPPEETQIEASVETSPEETQIEASVETLPEEAQIEASVETPPEETQIEASVETPPEETEINASVESPLPNGLAWHERNNSQPKQLFMNKTFQELNCDADFQKRMNALGAALRGGANKTDALPENAETTQILATAMLSDENAVILASRTHYTDGVTKERKNVLETLIECAAGNATAATLAAADLGVIKYLSLFFQQMFANDTFRRALRFVPMSDRAGAIYIEDGVNAPTYVGNNTPLNVPLYQYEDIKRTIARRVFAFSPILFQHSELAILAYDKQGHGIQTTMAKSMEDFSTYILQVIANTQGISKIKTTGGIVPTQGLFPIEAPNSNVSVHKPQLDDILSLESEFLMQQYTLNGRSIECVLPGRVYGMLASDPECRNRLIKEINGNLASHINFSATRITPRNPVARFNTASNAAELDPSLYADNNVADNGTFTPITPAVTTADHVGAGVAFVENEVIAGVGAIELIVERDPRNYGTVISGWFSGGATVARQNGVGAALIIPAV